MAVAMLRKNVVSYLYVVHCSIDGIQKKAFVKAESDAVARSKALAELMNEYKTNGAVDFQVISLERIDPEEDL